MQNSRRHPIPHGGNPEINGDAIQSKTPSVPTTAHKHRDTVRQLIDQGQDPDPHVPSGTVRSGTVCMQDNELTPPVVRIVCQRKTGISAPTICENGLKLCPVQQRNRQQQHKHTPKHQHRLTATPNIEMVQPCAIEKRLACATISNACKKGLWKFPMRKRLRCLNSVTMRKQQRPCHTNTRIF